MAPKRKVEITGCRASKKRKAIRLEVKLEIVKRSDKGETPTNIARSLGFSRSTVATIIKDKKRIIEHVKGAAVLNSTIITKQRSVLLIEMERLLVIWLQDQTERGVPVSLMAIQEEARRIYEVLKSEKGEGIESEQFVASKGWFNRFKVRANLHNRKIKDEQEAAGADEQEAAKPFPAGMADIVREGGYLPQQVFNVDETDLFWKRVPSRRYRSVELKCGADHNKASKERLTLLFGCNASGDCKLKPLLVYLTENPRVLKGIFKSQLPVIWKSNKKAWVTHDIFEDWFTNSFVPEVERYCTKNSLPFKALLVLDNAPGHPSQLNDLHPNVKVVYLPENTTSLIQPMDQGVVASFKAYYLRRMINSAFKAIERNKHLTLKDFLKSYNIYDAVKNIADAWDELKMTTLNGAWRKLCPQFVNNFEGFEETLESVTERIVEISKELDLEVDVDDVNELLESQGERLTEDDLVQLEKQMVLDEEEAPDPEPRLLTVKGLSKGISLVEAGMACLEAEDPNVERYTKVLRRVMDSLSFYRETLEEKRKNTVQPSLECYFKKCVSQPQD